MCELTRRGVAAVAICSEPFLKLGKAQSRVFGVPDLPLVVIPHPLGGISIEQVEGRALAALSQVVQLIKGQRKCPILPNCSRSGARASTPKTISRKSTSSISS